MARREHTRMAAVMDADQRARELSAQQRETLRILAHERDGARIYDSGAVYGYDPRDMRIRRLGSATVAALIGRGLAGRRDGRVHVTAEGLEVARAL